MTTGAHLADAAVRDAIAASHLAAVPEPLLERLVVDAVRLRAPAGSHVRREGDPGPHVELVVGGLIRIFVSAPDGRTQTVRYCRPGALTGVVSLFRPDYVMPGGMQAILDTDLLVLRPAEARALADRELDVARAMVAELAERAHLFAAEIPGSSFATVRQRVARHLLDLASDRQRDARLVAPISQQALADAAGTVREVVVRVLGDLRRDGLVATGPGGIRILDPGRLASEVFAPELSRLPGTARPER